MKTKAEKPPNYIPMQKSKMETKAHKKHKHEKKHKNNQQLAESIVKQLEVEQDGAAAKVKKHMVSKKRLEKRAQLKAATGKDETPEKSTCLLLRHLPQSINYHMLKSVVPDAVHVEIYKKGAKRHAFAQFESHKACKKTMKKLSGFKMDDREILVKYVSRRPKTQETTLRPPPSSDTCITLSNLPFSITQAELEEEFPTAAEIILNVNKNGRFRGSCLLRFESSDDCKVAWDACCGRKIGGRPVQCRAGLCFQGQFAQPTRQQWGIKLCGLPVEVTNTQLASLFPRETFIRAHCELNAEGSSKTGIVQFSCADAQKNAIQKLNQNEFFGVRIRCRPWVPRKRRSKPLSLVGEQDSAEHPPSSTKTKRKHSAVVSDEQADTSLQGNPVSPQSGKKTKRPRGSLGAEDADLSALSDLNTSFKKKKKHQREGDSF